MPENQAIHAGDKDVLHAAITQLGDHLQPELGTLVLSDPQAKDFLLARQVDARRQVRRLHPDGSFTHLGVDAVQVDDGVEAALSGCDC